MGKRLLTLSHEKDAKRGIATAIKWCFVFVFSAIRIEGADFQWDNHSEQSAVATLRNISVRVPHGRLLAVCGAVGRYVKIV